MLALRYYGQRDIRLEDIKKPELKSNEVLLRVTDAGISQTQINEFIEGPFIIDKIPLIPCQEFGGIVENVANKEDEKFLNKRVAVLPLVSCGKCEYCKKKEENLCDNLGYYGLLGLDGGFAQYAAINRDNIFLIEKEELLTFIEPILVGIHSAHQYKKLDEIENKNILVLGAGAVGISVASVWRDYFKADVVINDILESRLDKVKNAGLSTIKKSKIEKKFDVVIDAAGMDVLSKIPAFNESFDYLKKGGVYINIGTYFHPLKITPSNILLPEQSILTSIAYNFKDVEILNSVLDSLKVDFSKLITEVPLKNIIEDGYYVAEIDKSRFVRIVVKP